VTEALVCVCVCTHVAERHTVTTVKRKLENASFHMEHGITRPKCNPNRS